MVKNLIYLWRLLYIVFTLVSLFAGFKIVVQGIGFILPTLVIAIVIIPLTILIYLYVRKKDFNVFEKLDFLIIPLFILLLIFWIIVLKIVSNI